MVLTKSSYKHASSLTTLPSLSTATVQNSIGWLTMKEGGKHEHFRTIFNNNFSLHPLAWNLCDRSFSASQTTYREFLWFDNAKQWYEQLMIYFQLFGMDNWKTLCYSLEHV